MNHSFDIEHAGLYGIHEAVLIQNLQFWIGKNVANGVHQYEGRTWTYNSAKAYALLFPYLSDRQIRRTIDSLESQLVVIKGNFNKSPADRTLWLAFLDEAMFLTMQKPSPKTANGAPKTANAIAGIGESLIRTDVNTNINTDGKKKAQAPAFLLPEWINEKHWDAWHSCSKRKTATSAQKQLAVDKLETWKQQGIDYAAALENAAIGGWQGLFKPDDKKPALSHKHTGFDKRNYEGVNENGTIPA